MDRSCPRPHGRFSRLWLAVRGTASLSLPSRADTLLLVRCLTRTSSASTSVSSVSSWKTKIQCKQRLTTIGQRPYRIPPQTKRFNFSLNYAKQESAITLANSWKLQCDITNCPGWQRLTRKNARKFCKPCNAYSQQDEIEQAPDRMP